MTAADEAQTHRRKQRKHAYIAAAAERQVAGLLDKVAREWAKAGMYGELAIAAEAAAREERARAAVAASEEN